MTADPVAVMVAAGESETVELRTTTGAHREAAMTVCAMVKQQGGLLVFYITPEGKAVGQQVVDWGSGRGGYSHYRRRNRNDRPVERTEPSGKPNSVGQGREVDSIRLRTEDRHPRPLLPKKQRTQEFRRVERGLAGSDRQF